MLKVGEPRGVLLGVLIVLQLLPLGYRRNDTVLCDAIKGRFR
jgi:hypothetical protein